MTAYQRKVTPLDKIAAHGANNGCVSAKLLPDGLYQGEVTIMQGIIFCYDTSGFHICHLKAVTKKCQFGKNGDCILRRICYNGKSNYCVNAKCSFLLYLNYGSLTRLSQKKKEN